MTPRRIVALFAVSVLIASGALAQKKPKIVILATGGTIAGAALKPTDPGYQSGAVGVDILIAAVPQLKEIAEVTGEQIASIGSQDMNDEVWLKLAKRTNELLAGDAAGVVVTHGTDTLEETSYFLHLVVKSDKPVVMTGSMRPSTAMSADGPLNIYNAVAIAADPTSKGRGVLVTVDDDIHSAHDVVKTHTTDVGTFSSGELGLVGATLFGKQTWFRTPAAVHTTKSEFSIAANTNTLPRVDIIYAHANMSPDVITNAVKSGAKGIVVAGVGDGNMTAPAFEALQAVAKQGAVAVRSSRTNGGIIRRNIELNDDKAGTVASMELNPAKARVLLQLALMKSSDAKKVQDYFNRY
jgi:L-asparaginase